MAKNNKSKDSTRKTAGDSVLVLGLHTKKKRKMAGDSVPESEQHTKKKRKTNDGTQLILLIICQAMKRNAPQMIPLILCQAIQRNQNPRNVFFIPAANYQCLTNLKRQIEYLILSLVDHVDKLLAKER